MNEVAIPCITVMEYGSLLVPVWGIIAESASFGTSSPYWATTLRNHRLLESYPVLPFLTSTQSYTVLVPVVVVLLVVIYTFTSVRFLTLVVLVASMNHVGFWKEKSGLWQACITFKGELVLNTAWNTPCFIVTEYIYYCSYSYSAVGHSSTFVGREDLSYYDFRSIWFRLTYKGVRTHDHIYFMVRGHISMR